MGKEIGLYFLMFVFLFSFAYAEALPPHQIETDLSIYQECFNCTYCNFTSFKDPSGTSLLSNMVAVQDDTHYSYLITSGNITEQGTYRYCYNCGNAVEAETGCIDVPVNYTGSELTIPQTLMYFFVFLFLVGVLIYLLYLYPKLPQHTTNESGYVIDVADMSYLRPIALGGMWILIMAITFIIANVSIAYITAGFLGKFLFGIWTIMMYSNLLIVPLYIIYLINDFYKTAKLKEFLERGGMTFG